MGTAIHANRVAGTGFHAQAAVNAAQRIDLIANRVLLDGIIRIFAGLDVDTLGRAGGRAKKASGAVSGVVLVESQPVTPAKRVRIRRSLLRVLDRDGGLKSFCQTKRMENVDAEITPEVITGYGKAAQYLRDIGSLPERHRF